MKPKIEGAPGLATVAFVVLVAGLATGTRGGDDSGIQGLMNQVHTRNRLFRTLREGPPIIRPRSYIQESQDVRNGVCWRQLPHFSPLQARFALTTSCWMVTLSFSW